MKKNSKNLILNGIQPTSHIRCSVFQNLKVITLSGAASGGMRPGVQVQVLEAHQHTLFRHLKNEFFSRNLGQNILRIF